MELQPPGFQVVQPQLLCCMNLKSEPVDENFLPLSQINKSKFLKKNPYNLQLGDLQQM